MSPREKKIRTIQRIIEAYEISFQFFSRAVLQFHHSIEEIIPPHDDGDKPKSSREEFRRLEMLKLHPPVTNDEYVQLEKIVDLTEKAQKNNAAIRRRLNLD
jgi:hypothetical protein